MIFKKNTDADSDEASNWYKDKFEFVRQQRDVLVLITLVSLACAAIGVFTISSLTPYKSVEPFVIQIDEKSGIVKRVNPVTRDEFTANEAVDRFFVAQYIRFRESYMPSTFRENYNAVRVMSDRFTFNKYATSVSERNPESPVALLKNSGTRTVKFKNLSYVNRGSNTGGKVMQARIILTDVHRRFPTPVEYHNVVTIKFQYSNLDLNEEERYINPLGFLVTSYEIDREVIE